MKDSLKEFIGRNREAFDDKEPSDNTWRGIRASLGSSSLWNSITLWRVAAMLLLGLSGYLFATKDSTILKKKEVAQLQVEFDDLEKFYSSQIAEKVALISSLDGIGEQDQFTQDIQKLEAMYQVLGEEMKNKPSEKVKDALILNLLVRIDLLNQQLKKLEDSRKESKSVKPSEV